MHSLKQGPEPVVLDHYLLRQCDADFCFPEVEGHRSTRMRRKKTGQDDDLPTVRCRKKAGVPCSCYANRRVALLSIINDGALCHRFTTEIVMHVFS